MKTRVLGDWVYYFNEEKNNELNLEKCGKWMVFYKHMDYAAQICKKAIEENIVLECKHNADDGVACFYIEFDDIASHKRVIQFFLENGLIPKTKLGKLYNISFKLDMQTRACEYGERFMAQLKLEDFINLTTGAWHMDEKTVCLKIISISLAQKQKE